MSIKGQVIFSCNIYKNTGLQKIFLNHIAGVPIYSETITHTALNLRLQQEKSIPFFPEQCFSAAHQSLTQFIYVVTHYFKGKRCIKDICP